ncbi:C-C motif chemokine 27a [Puntigrus tetrazona]|uniref:C-C motif chemokine 27a n=1 Tax=Puntigrus tetrazona TaxID=1606681 RepID=UPI001C8AC619|nr:C-C motif chemokine 27a [Puntigrus tetrazona]
MKLRTTSVLPLAFVVVTIIILTSTEVDGIPSCCVRLSKNIPRSKLRLVTKHEMQLKSGVCDIDAAILHVGKQRICVHPKVLKLLKRLKKQRKAKRIQAKIK